MPCFTLSRNLLTSVTVSGIGISSDTVIYPSSSSKLHPSNSPFASTPNEVTYPSTPYFVDRELKEYTLSRYTNHYCNDRSTLRIRLHMPVLPSAQALFRLQL